MKGSVINRIIIATMMMMDGIHTRMSAFLITIRRTIGPRMRSQLLMRTLGSTIITGHTIHGTAGHLILPIRTMAIIPLITIPHITIATSMAMVMPLYRYDTVHEILARQEEAPAGELQPIRDMIFRLEEVARVCQVL